MTVWEGVSRVRAHWQDALIFEMLVLVQNKAVFTLKYLLKHTAVGQGPGGKVACKI